MHQYDLTGFGIRSFQKTLADILVFLCIKMTCKFTHFKICSVCSLAKVFENTIYIILVGLHCLKYIFNSEEVGPY